MGWVVGLVLFAALMGFLHMCGVGLLKGFVGTVMVMVCTAIAMALIQNPGGLFIGPMTGLFITMLPDLVRRSWPQ